MTANVPPQPSAEQDCDRSRYPIGMVPLPLLKLARPIVIPVRQAFDASRWPDWINE